MKKLYLSLLLISLSVFSFSQEIKEDYIDEFYGNHIIRTTWADMAFGLSNSGFFRMSKIDTNYFLDYREIGSLPYGSFVSEGNNFFFKFSDGEVMALYNTEGKMVSRGGGSTGLNGSGVDGITLHLLITKQQMDKILSKKVVKFRIQTDNGYRDHDFSDMRDEKLTKLITLVYK
jgi:hypothetical protein